MASIYIVIEKYTVGLLLPLKVCCIVYNGLEIHVVSRNTMYTCMYCSSYTCLFCFAQEFATKIINETHEHWQKLVTKKTENKGEVAW